MFESEIYSYTMNNDYWFYHNIINKFWQKKKYMMIRVKVVIRLDTINYTCIRIDNSKIQKIIIKDCHNDNKML